MRFLFSTVAVAAAVVAGVAAPPSRTLDRDAARWVDETLKKLSVDEKVGQLIVPALESDYLSTDSRTFDELTRLVKGTTSAGSTYSARHNPRRRSC